MRLKFSGIKLQESFQTYDHLSPTELLQTPSSDVYKVST